MKPVIRSAAVIGSGVMGAAIAAHLANSGVPVRLLDLVPERLTPEEEKQGKKLTDPDVRNRLALNAIRRLRQTSPAPLYEGGMASLITPGNLEDDLHRLREADWIIEAIVERMDAKKQLFARLEPVWTPGTIVSTNTSGLSIAAMTEHCSEAFREHFLGTHFFNPPRYMKLLEIIPGPSTKPEIVEMMSDFAERRLGKGVVLAKDTPNFIANRIGTYGLMITLRAMLDHGFTVEEIDAVTGPAMGRPKSATFRTLDLVGIDTFVHVADNVFQSVQDRHEKEVFAVPELLRTMVSRGWTGEKGGQGFYQKIKGEQGSQILALHPAAMTYAPVSQPKGAALEAAKAAKGAAAKIRALLAAGDRYSELAWHLLKASLVYAAQKAGEIADSVQDIDRAMRWGFNWELGPFEIWDAIGLERSVARMESEGTQVPAWVKEWIAAGHRSFYQREAGAARYASADGTWRREPDRPERISLRLLKEQQRVVKSNAGASLIDLGDGVACLEFHSPNNAIGEDILTMIRHSVEEVRRNYEGLVIANEGRNFCVGANLMLLLAEAQDEEWEEIDWIIRLFQDSMMLLKRLEKPVVAAPHRMTLGGGVEVCLAADRVVAAPETYYGLVETGVGLIPAGGGCKEMVLRLGEKLADGAAGDAAAGDSANAAASFAQEGLSGLSRIFETIGMAKVSTSGHDAIRMGLMRPCDRVVMNEDHRIHEAKMEVLHLARSGYRPMTERPVRVMGAEAKAVLKLAAYSMRLAGQISEHDEKIAGKLAHVLAGGDVPAGTPVSEQYLLDLEREAFLSLCGEPKTQARMLHMLTKGKPLRN